MCKPENSDIIPTSGQTPARENAPRRNRQSDRELAKLGMTVSLGILVATGLSRTHTSRRVHIWAGTALVGFSVWHHMLYAPSPNKNRGARS